VLSCTASLRPLLLLLWCKNHSRNLLSIFNGIADNSEQLFPMFGLTKLHHVGDAETTLDKIHFLFQNVMTKSNRLTAIISFSALFALVAFRYFKNKFKGTWWIYRLPEVLIVVVASTSQIYLWGTDHNPDIIFTVLSAEFKWEKHGIDILGAVDIRTGESFLEFPLKASNIKLLRRTTSTAMSVRFHCFY
jgi:Sulfate permease family